MWEKLKQLHSYNGWIIIILIITGLALYIPEFRGGIADYRVSIKNAHIIIGALLILIFISYIPFSREHWKSLENGRIKRFNLICTLMFIAIWIVSGVLLVVERRLPSALSQMALLLHDYITWISIPVIP
jgi:methionine sulfoxide reductase catalytic subunit